MTIFIGAIIVIAFMATIADDVYTQTNTFSLENVTLTTGAVDTNTSIGGRELVGTDWVISNATEADSGPIPSLSLQTGTDATTGLRTVQLVTNATSSAAGYDNLAVNVSYVQIPDGYLNTSGARSIQSLVLIVGALAILVFAVVLLIKKGSLGEMIRRR